MNLRRTTVLVAGLATVATFGLGTVAHAADGSATTAPQRCEHVDDIEARIAHVNERIDARRTELERRLAEAQAAGQTHRVHRLERYLQRLANFETRVDQRTVRFHNWVAEHCDDAAGGATG